MAHREWIGPYRIVGRLSKEKATERLYQGETEAGERVVLHEVDVSGGRARELLELAEREHQVTRNLDHAGLLHAHEPTYERHWGRIVSVVRALEPFPSDSLRNAAPSDLAEICDAFRQVAEALEALHATGWVHSDIRPESVLIDRHHQVKVTNLGWSAPKGQARACRYISDFMAPEQLSEQPLTPRTDVYSLGATLYWAITGWRPPPVARKTARDQPLTAYEKPRHPREIRSDIPRALASLALECLHGHVEERPDCMVSVARRLTAAHRQIAGPAAAQSPPDPDDSGAQDAESSPAAAGTWPSPPAEGEEPGAGTSEEAAGEEAAASTTDGERTIRMAILGADEGTTGAVTDALELFCEETFQVETAPLGHDPPRVGDETPDLILVSLDPDDQGQARTARRLLEAEAHVPTILLCPGEQQSAALELIRAGAHDCLDPDDLDGPALAQTLQRAIARHEWVSRLQGTTSQLREMSLRLRRVTEEDPVTGLGSRHGMAKCLARESAGAERGDPGAAIFVECALNGPYPADRQKRVAWIQQLGRGVRAPLRQMDYAARLGDTDFLILLRDANRAEARRVAERVREQLGRAAPQTVVHLAVFDLSGASRPLDALYTRGRQLVAGGKRRGHPVVLDWSLPDERRLSAETLAALEGGGGLAVAAQPIRGLRDGAIRGYEMITRAGPGGEHPDVFFGLCREAGGLTTVDRQCLLRAAASAVTLEGEGRRDLNLFPDTLAEIGAEGVLQALPPDTDPGRFCLELPDTEMAGSPAALAAPLQGLREAGMELGIEGVVPGRDGLESLLVLEPDTIKLHPHWVAHVAENPVRHGALERLITAVRHAGARIGAVGVDARADADALAALGVEEGQGALWDTPIPVTDTPERE